MYEWLLTFNVVLFGAATVVYLSRPFSSIMHPGTWILLFHGLIFVLRPILANYYQYDLIYRVYQFNPSLNDKILALIVADLAFVVMLYSACHVGNLPYRFITKYNTKLSEGYKKSFLMMCLILSPMAAYSLYDVIVNPLFDTMAHDYKTGQIVNTTGNGYVQNFQVILLPVVVGIAWLFRFRITYLAIPAAYMIVKAATGSRWPIVICFIWIMVLYLIENRKRWLDWRYALLAIAVWGAFVSIGSDRGDSVRTALFGLDSKQDVAVDYEHLKPFESMDYANLEFLEYIVHVVPDKSETYDYYLTNSRILTEPIPRVLWEDKPIGAPFANVDLWKYGTPVGMTFSVGGVGWFDAGWVGVIVWSALFGSFYGLIYNYFVRHRTNPFVVFSYSLMIALTLQLFRDGVLISVLKFTLFTISPILIWRLLSRDVDLQEYQRKLARRQPDIAPKLLARQRALQRPRRTPTR